MNRRSFMTALFGGLAVTAAGATLTSTDTLAAPLPADTASDLDTLEAEFTQYHHRRRPRRHRRRVCTVRRDRFGRPVRHCRWVY
jgi:hypothetical protein